MDGLIWTFPCPPAIRFPYAANIFLLLGHREYVEKYLDGGAIWIVAPESSVQE